MHLYSFTLQNGSFITHAVLGNFSGSKQQEIVISRGNILELYRPDMNTYKVQPIHSIKVFGVIRSLITFRLTGGSKDYVIVGSDSGRIVILEYNSEKNAFDKLHEETFGKSGCRRIVPGQFLTVDPKGRAVMIAALEKQKLVYILNRDSSARLTISSPLEAHKSKTLVYDIAALDNGYENPLFACLELDYSEIDEDPTGTHLAEVKQCVVLYELDLGLNHVVRKQSEELENLCYKIISVPAGKDTPGGMLLCSENYITYKNIGEQEDVRIPIPRRKSCTRESVMIVAAATHKTKSLTFFLLQTEQGDVFKLTLDCSAEDEIITVVGLRIKYIDTLLPAVSMCILKAGFLFVTSEFGDHHLYRIAYLGQDEDQEYSSSDEYLSIFEPRELKNLVVVDTMESLSPITDCKITQLTDDDTPQFYMLSGRGGQSSFRVLRHGLEVTEMAVSELPGSPLAVWTVKTHDSDPYHSYIVVAFINATLVLSIGETVEEVSDSGFLGVVSTLSASSIGEDALLQVYPSGIRHIRADKRINEWKAPAPALIVNCVAVALTGNDIVYFELDAFGQLNEFNDRLSMSGKITCLAIGPVPDGRQRCRFMAVGLDDNTIRVISLDPEDCLQTLSMQALPSQASSLAIVRMDGSGVLEGALYLYIGLQNGVMLRTVIDPVAGVLEDTRTRYLGSLPVKLHRMNVQGAEAVIALSSRSWLSYSHQGRVLLTPLSYDPLSYAAMFSSEYCPEGVVAIAKSSLRIVATEKLGVSFNQTSVPLNYTPRKFTIHPQTNLMLILEAESRCADSGHSTERTAATDGARIWCSCICVLDPSSNEVIDVYSLPNNECPTSITACSFFARGDEVFVVVGVGVNMGLSPLQCSAGAIYVFRMVEGGRKLDLVHKTEVESPVGSLCAFQGRMLAGVGRSLRIYDVGKRKLLKKCENKNLPNYIVHLMSLGNRIYAGDIQESYHFVKYNGDQNRLVIYADDVVPRWVVAGCLLDYHTVAGADKFGNIFILRLPANATDDIDDDPSGAKVVWQRGLLSGAPQKLECLVNYHVGELVVSLQKVTLVAGGGECLIYTTIRGTIGVLAPFTTREDVDFFQILEMHMQHKYPPLCGRDHLSYRSFYFPRKNVVDGDLTEQFNILPSGTKEEIASETTRTAVEVSKKLEDMRARFAF